MASTLTPTIAPDTVLSFEINEGTLGQLLETRAEGGPRLKCFEGSVTLVSPGKPHEKMRNRLDKLVTEVCLALGVEFEALGSTTWALPSGAGDTAYEADVAYYVQSYATAKDRQPPDLAIEVVVTHSEKKALKAGAFLKIPELWVLDLNRNRLTFHHLITRGRDQGLYRPRPRSRAFPDLLSAEVLQRLNDPEPGDTAFIHNCRAWVQHVLLPRRREMHGRP